MGELARRARLSKQTMTQLTRQLESEGLVERRVDPEDARASRILLTARARRFQPVAADVLARLDRLVRRRLGATRVEELKAVLRELLDVAKTS
jgi:DNA-binding MarR family transcriptional regulator